MKSSKDKPMDIMEWHSTAPKGGKMNKETDNLVIHDTQNYQIVLHPDDPDMLWYWIVNKENRELLQKYMKIITEVAETRDALKKELMASLGGSK